MSAPLHHCQPGRHPLPDFVTHLLGVRPVRHWDATSLEWRLGDPDDDRRVLLLGHLDTVWPHGTLARRPLEVTEGRVTGPGVCLVLEGAGPGGAVKSARRGWSFYTVELHGVAAHAGLEPDAGVNVLHGGPNRPPMEADAALRQLANLTAAVGVPTLDGLGAVGGGPHAEHEWIDLAGTRERAPTLAALVRDLLDDPLTDPEPTEDR